MPGFSGERKHEFTDKGEVTVPGRALRFIELPCRKLTMVYDRVSSHGLHKYIYHRDNGPTCPRISADSDKESLSGPLCDVAPRGEMSTREAPHPF